MELIGRGRQAEVYACGEKECIKLFYETCPSWDIEHEAEVMQKVSDFGIPTARFLGRLEKDGRQGLRMERLSGSSMLSCILSDPQRLDEYGELLGRMQRDYHRLSGEGLGRLSDNLRYGINRTSLLSEEEKAELIRRLDLIPDGSRLVHMDYHPDNVIITSDGAKIIDWACAACGDPLADAARTYLTCGAGAYPIGASEELCRALDEYRAVLQRAFLRGYGITLEELSGWLPIIAGARLFCAPEEEQEVDLRLVRDSLGQNA